MYVFLFVAGMGLGSGLAQLHTRRQIRKARANIKWLKSVIDKNIDRQERYEEERYEKD